MGCVASGAERDDPWSGDAAVFRAENLANWSERAPMHAQSPDYGTRELIADPEAISDVVRFDLPLLGDISGLRVLHLQCHIGTDTVSLARLGATVTGLDFSAAAVVEGRALAAKCGVDVRFVEGDAYEAVRLLGEGSFDLVYTGIGALCWLPRIDLWAGVVSALLVPGGRLFIREGHPMLWALDERVPDVLLVRYPYFETPDPLSLDEPESYVSTERPLNASMSHSWNHGLGETVTALHEAGMRITTLVEHDSVPWDALPGHMVQEEIGEWRLREGRERLPLTYTLIAVRQAPA
jgi:SAM-dependent methyltransferase